MSTDTKYACIVAAVIVVCIVLSKSTFKPKTVSVLDSSMQRNLNLVVENIKQNLITAKQDSNILLALIHINTAVAKASMLAELVTPTEAEKYLNIKLDVLLLMLKEYQLKVLNGFHTQAPDIALPTDIDLG